MDDGEKKKLLDEIEANDAREHWGGGLVVFGLVVEVFLALGFHFDALKSNPFGTEILWTVVATFLIAVGVWMEIKFGHNSKAATDKLRISAEIELAELKKQAADANLRAVEANERILKMQEMRRLPKDKAEALAPLLKSDLFQKDPKPNLRVGSVADAEAQMYALEFQKFLESCGVNIYPTSGGFPTEIIQLSPNEQGLALVVKSVTNPVQAFARFQLLMHSIGIPLNVEVDPTKGENEAMLVIMRKPS